jgi:hypothetical protein
MQTQRGLDLESEPYLSLAKKLQEMKLKLQEALPWIETINEVAQMQNTDIKHAAIFVAQEQLGGIQRQIERANQELALINMTTIKKQQALTILMDLINRGVTESQILQLINFAGEWNKYWLSSTTGNLQQPNNPGPGSSNGNLQQPNNGSTTSSSGNFSINDLIRLNLLKSTTTNMLNRTNPPQ